MLADYVATKGLRIKLEVTTNVNRGQARVVLWDNIRWNHLWHLKVSLVAAIPHKSRAYRLILDLSFKLHLENGGLVDLVNNTMEKWTPRGAIDQLGHLLKRLIHAFAEADNDAVILMAKWDIEDGFWRLICCEGEEWNFCYIWPKNGRAVSPCGTHLLADGLGGISTIFLCSI
jgi:hypothetical protein